jgi:hypothetical protein
MSGDVNPHKIEMKGWLSRSSQNSDDLNQKAKDVFKISSDKEFTYDFFKRYENSNRSDIRIGKIISGPNSDVRGRIERVNQEDEEMIDFVKGEVSSVGLPILMQEAHFDKNFWKKDEVEEWLASKGLNANLEDSEKLYNHWKAVQIPKVNFEPSEWKLYSFKDEIKVIAGKFEQ